MNMPSISPVSPSMLRTILGVLAAMALSVGSWLTLSQISSQVVQAQTSVTVAGNKQKVDSLDILVRDNQITQQRLVDMIARHDEDIDRIEDDVSEIQGDIKNEHYTRRAR